MKICIFQIKLYFTINKPTTHKKTTTASDSSSTLYTNLTTCVLPCGLSWVRLPPLLCTDLPIVRLSVSLYRLGLPYNVPTFSFWCVPTTPPRLLVRDTGTCFFYGYENTCVLFRLTTISATSSFQHLLGH